MFSLESTTIFWWRYVLGNHSFPYRTRKLSLRRPMVLGGRLPGRVGGCHFFLWGRSSVGRAPALQAGGQEFESPRLHHFYI
jgi:hypothetical protein